MQKISNWPLRRFDREINTVIATLSGNVKQKWWSKEGVAPSEVVIGDSITCHLPALGATAVNAVLLRALLRPALGVPPLDAAIYVQLLCRFHLGREFAIAWSSLDVSRRESSSALIAQADAIIKALLAALAKGSHATQSQSSRDWIDMILAFLSLFCGASASTAAASLRSSGEQLARETSKALAREAVSLAIDTAQTEGLEHASEVLAGLSFCVAGLCGGSLAGDVELGDLSRQLRSLLSSSAQFEQAQSWLQVLDVVDEEVATTSEHIASMTHPRLEEADRRSFLASRESLLECLDICWPFQDSSELEQKVDIAEDLSARPEPFKINLYANPTARATQDAVVAALPPARRLETLLSVSKVDELDKAIPQFLQAWEEAPEECATVVMRSDAEGSASWPVEVVVPLLASLAERDAVGWQSAFAHHFPLDKSLFDAFWARLCNASLHESIATKFWPWALCKLCISRLSGIERDVEFGIHCSLRIALTLRADFAGARAKADLHQALAIKENFASDSAFVSGRIGGFKEAPIAALLLSLSEILEGGRSFSQNSTAFEAADESLENWVLLIREMAEDCPDIDLVSVLVDHLARVSSASATAGSYGYLHLANLSANVSSLRRQEASLLRACVFARHSAAHAQLSWEALGLELGTFDPLPCIYAALDAWPIRQLITLALRVLPAVIDSCQLILPIGEVFGRDLRTEPSSTSSLLKSIMCLLCCAAAKVQASPGEAMAQLRLGTDIARVAFQHLHAGCTTSDRSRDVAELWELFGSFAHALTKSSPKLLREASGPATAAGLLMRMLLKAATSEGHKNCCASLGGTMRQLEALSP